MFPEVEDVTSYVCAQRALQFEMIWIDSDVVYVLKKLCETEIQCQTWPTKRHFGEMK